MLGNILNIFKGPASDYSTSGMYSLFCQSKEPNACLTIDLEATWFYDLHGGRGNLARVEELIAGTSLFDGGFSMSLKEAKWLPPWGEFPLKAYKMAPMIQLNSIDEEGWMLHGVQVRAGVLALYYCHYRYPGRVCEVLLGYGFTELHLAVQTSNAVWVLVQKEGEMAPDRLTTEGSLCRTGIVLKRKTTQARGLAKLVSTPHIALEAMLNESLSVGGAPTIQSFSFTGEDYRLPMK